LEVLPRECGIFCLKRLCDNLIQREILEPETLQSVVLTNPTFLPILELAGVPAGRCQMMRLHDRDCLVK